MHLRYLLTIFCPLCLSALGGGCSSSDNELSEAEAGQTAANVAVSSMEALAKLAESLQLPIVQSDSDAGTVFQFVSGGEPTQLTGEFPGPFVDVGCTGGGQISLTCQATDKESNLVRLTFDACRATREMGKQPTVNGVIEALFKGVEPCDPQTSLSQEALKKIRYISYSTTVSEADGSLDSRRIFSGVVDSLEATEVDAATGMNAKAAGEAGAARVWQLSGAFEFFSEPENLDMAARPTDMIFEVTSSTDTMLEIIANGALDYEDRNQGIRLQTMFYENLRLSYSVPEDGLPRVELDGVVAYPCVGDIIFSTESPVTFPQEGGCPVGGVLRAKLPTTEYLIRFTSDGAIAVDIGANGTEDFFNSPCRAIPLPDNCK